MAKRKRRNNDLQNLSQKTKDRVTRTPLKTRGELRCCGWVISSCSTSGTRRVTLVTHPVFSGVPLVGQELLTLPQHMSPSPVFSGVRVTRSLVLYMYVLQIVVCPFVLFLLAIVLSVLLRQTDSDYHFGIFKLFLQLFKALFHINLVLQYQNTESKYYLFSSNTYHQ